LAGEWFNSLLLRTPNRNREFTTEAQRTGEHRSSGVQE
jgi:hypothetical protein